ncbi:UDP-glucose 4-epimerase, partial [Mesorhizobium sp. M00.F.Ca.ET.149.01.1.1]
RIIGTRHDEKLFEVLLSREEKVAAQDLGNYYRVPPDLRDLNYGKFFEQGEIEISESTDYNSHNTTRLGIKEMQSLLMKLRFVQAIVRGEHVEPEE